MSHIVEEGTLIENPDLETLGAACRIVADAHGGQVTGHYLNYSNQKQTPTTGLAVILPNMGRGIGLKVDERTGALVFIGDSWGVKPLYEQVQREIQQAYVSLAYMEVLRSHGYTPEATQEGAQIEIRGVLYA